jgi:hypothetical protein
MQSRPASRTSSRPASPGGLHQMPASRSALRRSSLQGPISGTATPTTTTTSNLMITPSLMLPSLAGGTSRPMSPAPGGNSPGNSRVGTPPGSQRPASHAHSLHHPPRTHGASIGGVVSLYAPQHNSVFGVGGLEMHMQHPLSDDELLRLHHRYRSVKLLLLFELLRIQVFYLIPCAAS